MNNVKAEEASACDGPSRAFSPPAYDHADRDPQRKEQKTEPFSSARVDSFAHNKSEQCSNADHAKDSSGPANYLSSLSLSCCLVFHGSPIKYENSFFHNSWRSRELNGCKSSGIPTTSPELLEWTLYVNQLYEHSGLIRPIF